VSAVPRAVVDRDTRGVIKLVAEAGTGRVRGVHAVADGAGEMITAASHAIRAQMTVTNMAQPGASLSPRLYRSTCALARLRIGWSRRPSQGRFTPGAGQPDPGDEPVPRAHGVLDEAGTDVSEPELAAPDQPQRAVA
jgi:Pyridine nucleotide-disulphide oxidoreductase, dimerisation domain